MARSASRCSTPNRCCSSTTTRPRSAKSTPSYSSAWVPTTMPAAPGGDLRQRPPPGRRAERAGDQRDPGAASGRRPARRPGPAGRAGRACPGSAARRAPRSGPAAPPARPRRPPGASPAARTPSCRSRPRPAAAGASGARRPGRRRSPRRPRAGPPVSSYGSRASNAASSPSSRRGRGRAGQAAARCLRCTRVELYGERLVPLQPAPGPDSASLVAGRWMSRSAVARPTRSRLARTWPAAGRPAGRRCPAPPGRTGRSPRSAPPPRPGRPGSARRRTPRSRSLAPASPSPSASPSSTYSGPLSWRLPRNSVDLAGEQPPPAGPQLALPPRLVAEEGQGEHRRRSRRRRSPPAGCPGRCRIGRTDARCTWPSTVTCSPTTRRPDVGVLAALVVAAREVVEQVTRGVQVEVVGERLGRLRRPTSFRSGVSTGRAGHSSPSLRPPTSTG